jgi:CheY-like chemotaxis protein
MGIILTVGPAGSTQETRQMLLESEGLQVKHVSSQDALVTVRQAGFDLVLLDFHVSEQTENEIRDVLDDSVKVIRLQELNHPRELLELVSRKVVKIDQRHS